MNVAYHRQELMILYAIHMHISCKLETNFTKSTHSKSHRLLQRHVKLWPMILTFEYDLYVVWMNLHSVDHLVIFVQQLLCSHWQTHRVDCSTRTTKRGLIILILELRLLLALLDVSYSGALQISRWLIAWLKTHSNAVKGNLRSQRLAKVWASVFLDILADQQTGRNTDI